MPDGPDLAALREKAEKADGYHVLVHPDVLLAVLSLVDRLQEIERLTRELLHDHEADQGFLPWCDEPFCGVPVCVAARKLREALDGSPAANEEPT